MRTHRHILIALSLIFVVGCTSTPPQITFYMLRGDAVEGQGKINARIRVGVGRIVMAPYLLGNRGIRIETGPGEFRPASTHQWAEPLDDGLRWFLREEIASDLGHEVGGGVTDTENWDYRVDVFVSRMHGTMDGRAILDAGFIVRSIRGGGGLSEYRFSKSLALPKEGYVGVVEAQRTLAREFASMIAGALRERMEDASKASE
jgi:uncharacterized lipoprotein YmbA